LYGYALTTAGVEIGTVHNFLFDDLRWNIRYLVVETGGWLRSRKVLIDPVALGRPDFAHRSLPVDLTPAQVRNSPDVDTEKPVSRRFQIALHQHFGWPRYWMPEPVLGMTPIPAGPTPIVPIDDEGDPHLRSAREIIGYSVRASDGPAGDVTDFVLDDRKWIIRRLVIALDDRLARGREILVRPSSVESISWKSEQILLEFSRERLSRCLHYDPALPVNRVREIRRYDFYGRPVGQTPPVPRTRFPQTSEGKEG
jgi:hypothetical protein